MKHSLSVTLVLVCLFLVSQYIGLFVLREYIDTEKTQKTGETAYKDLPLIGPVQFERPQTDATTSGITIALSVLIGTGLVLLLARFKAVRLWKAWFFLAVSGTLTVALAAFLPGLPALLISIILAGIKTFKPNTIVHNLTELFMYAGLAAIFVPILNILVMSILYVLLAGYDMYAVWKSQHMVTLAKFQTNAGMFAGMLLPYKESGQLTVGTPAPKKLSSDKGVRTAILGGGDIGFPLLFAGVVMSVFGFAKALIIPAFTALGLLYLLVVAQPKKFYPAIPFLAVGSFVGLLIVWLL